MVPTLDSLPESITAPRTDAIYNCHAYLTKVPVAAVRPFIAALSAPGDTIVDFFAGSGMTGLAALMTGRKAVLSDISVLGQHIAKGYLAEVSPSAYRHAADSVTKTARAALGDLYKTRRATDGAIAEIVRTVWSFTYVCPVCSNELVYFEHLSPLGAAPGQCPSCDGPFRRRNWSRGEDVPVDVVVAGETGKLVSQDVSALDREMIAMAASDPVKRMCRHCLSMSIVKCTAGRASEKQDLPKQRGFSRREMRLRSSSCGVPLTPGKTRT